MSLFSSISGDGRFVAFASAATNLVPDDTNDAVDIFVHDNSTGQTTRVSVSSRGAQANSLSVLPNISADGRFVAFESAASNLVAGDTNGTLDIFVHDRLTGQTVRASVSSSGQESNGRSDKPTISGNGRFVSFFSPASNLVAGDTNNATDVFVRDLVANRTTRESVSSSGAQGNAESGPSTINHDGRFVAFTSSANNLVPGDTNGVSDIFARDRATGQTIRASIGNDGSQANAPSDNFTLSLSANGRRVTYQSSASNLVAADNNGQIDIFASSMTPQ
jgi:archaellum component FlaF (FlaF/FlaG flagellin family)